jgi:hypothetical protein
MSDPPAADLIGRALGPSREEADREDVVPPSYRGDGRETISMFVNDVTVFTGPGLWRATSGSSEDVPRSRRTRWQLPDDRAVSSALSAAYNTTALEHPMETVITAGYTIGAVPNIIQHSPRSDGAGTGVAGTPER